MSASMKWRYLGHLQLLSKTVAAMVEMEVSPQEEMANPQGMEVFSVERPVLTCDSITVTSTWELTSVSMRYSQGDGVNTSLSRLGYCIHV